LERADGAGFDEETVALCETLGALLGPIFHLKQENERGALALVRDLSLRKLEPLTGRGHAGAKLVALTLLALAVFFSVFTTDYRVSARAVLEGSVQRAAVAPFDGHIAESHVRAGDIVRSGQLLARLDDRDLKLERTRLVSERAQARGKHKQSLATQDRASMGVFSAQVAELDAQVALVEDRLSRANLTAPFDGVVVSGDLSQLLDTPVERGKILFQIAPLNSYRVILEVDERDISQVRRDQPGELLLSGLPGRPMPIAVQQITPVATSQEGRNFFRVEARLAETDGLRPGMEGVAKVDIGRQRLIWIWTHGLIDWLRIFAWKQAP
jgi:RND family efflux transporter MFP subunit